jgi:hypothetical protein
MAQGALDSQRRELFAVVKKALEPNHRVKLEQSNRRRGGGQVQSSACEGALDGLWQGSGIYFQSYCESGLGADTGADTPKFFAGDGFMKAQCVTPESFASKSVLPEDLAPAPDHMTGVGVYSEILKPSVV